MKKLLFTFFILFLLSSCSQKPISIETLLMEMTNREAPARFPDPEYTLKQFSSYDRATVAPGDSTWFANWDRSMFIRTDSIGGRKEYVMMDAEGPGAIVRFWMTFAGENSGLGILRFYFDHNDTPAIEGKAFDILSGNQLVEEPLACSVSDSTEYKARGHNLYLPLPYAKHCKVTYESENIKDPGAKTGGEAAYYNINYRTYTRGVKVTTFSDEELTKAGKTLQVVSDKLQKRELETDVHELQSNNIWSVIAPGSKAEFEYTGPGAIRQLKLRLAAENLEQALRSTVLEVAFDGDRTVWCPLGDFFGTGYQVRFSNTWYSSVDQDGTMISRWVMPFRENAIVTFHNLGESEVSLEEAEILTSPWKWDTRSMHFGTSWHQFTRLETGEQKNNEGGGGPFDINYVELSGKGVYMGDAITLFNTVYAWWGEGDEKIFVDGESFPSHIGTGTEDYYGYAWCRPEKFSNHPFIAQPDGSGNFWPGYTVNIRYRGLDGIPFNQSLKMDFEMWHWTKAVINHAPVTFWYTIPGGKSNIKPDINAALEKVVLKRTDLVLPLVEDGKIEAEIMELINTSGGNVQYQGWHQPIWSGNTQLFWTDAKPGDWMKLGFISNEEGMKELHAVFTLAPDYGSFKIYLNDKLAKSYNAYHDEVITRLVSLGNHKIHDGPNEIKVEITGLSPDKQRAFFGMDVLMLK